MSIPDIQLDRIIKGARFHPVFADFAWDTQCQCVLRNLGVVRHHGAGRNECAESNGSPVQDYATRADEAVVLNRAALKMSVMADDTAVTNDGWMLSRAVNHRAILNGGL